MAAGLARLRPTQWTFTQSFFSQLHSRHDSGKCPWVPSVPTTVVAASADQKTRRKRRRLEASPDQDRAPGFARSSESFRLRFRTAGRRVSARTPDAAAKAEETVDGSLLTGDGSTLLATQQLVECAMLAATAGLAFFLGTLLHVEGHLQWLFPLPLVLAGMRWGVAAARKTLVTTTLLLFLLSGPLKASYYLTQHGLMGLAMGALWKLGATWTVSLFACSVVRIVGLLGSIKISSWIIGENILALIVASSHGMLTRLCQLVGLSSGPSYGVVYAFMAVLLLINSLSVVFILHIIYVLLLQRLGLGVAAATPKWIKQRA